LFKSYFQGRQVTHPAKEEIVRNVEEALKPAPIEEQSSMARKSKKVTEIQADMVEASLLSFDLEEPYRFRWSVVLGVDLCLNNG
jgi:hypothetical protein